jgi:hypothetical protein
MAQSTVEAASSKINQCYEQLDCSDTKQYKLHTLTGIRESAEFVRNLNDAVASTIHKHSGNGVSD